jgi:DNA-binding XRE family transcriptional regulator
MKATDNTERKKTIRKMSFDEMKDKYIGMKGTPERDSYELELKVEVLGEVIKKVRKERHLTQEELGKLVGVNKSQISKLERNTKNVTIATILKIFNALRANIKFSVEKYNDNLEKGIA